MQPDPFTSDLFGDFAAREPCPLVAGAVLLRGFALDAAAPLLQAVDTALRSAPLRRMFTPGGRPMSVAMSNSGEFGWVSDRRGYRYTREDPVSGRHWPAMPKAFTTVAAQASVAAGFAPASPDACLINRYAPGARMSLHQDRNERDLTAPIVSVSLGLPAVFLFGGLARGDRVRRVALHHGDVVVWGGPARLAFHGIAPLRDGVHPITGRVRWNLTLRRAG